VPTGFPVVLSAIAITVVVDKAPEGIVRITLLSEVVTVPPSEPIVVVAKTSLLLLPEVPPLKPPPPPSPPPPHPVNRVREKITANRKEKKQEGLLRQSLP
jgi:hypothetical protein